MKNNIIIGSLSCILLITIIISIFALYKKLNNKH